MADEDFDVLVLGAGISGINAAYRVRQRLPSASFTILEGRDCLSGTWNFWKYPGFRCDSQMSSYGLQWYPWTNPRTIVEGKVIAEYIDEATTAVGLKEHIRFGHKVRSANWDDALARWDVKVQAGDKEATFRARWVISCMGYYSYEKALETTIPGVSDFAGTLVHPQWWPEDLDYADKRIALVGSGATAMTIFPVLARTARRVTLIQRSPSYVAAVPTRSRVEFFRKYLPATLAWSLTRWASLLIEGLFISVLSYFPNFGRWLLRSGTIKALPRGYAVDTHFKPKYDPWAQRMILSPEGDVFEALSRSNAEIVTDTIDRMTSEGITTVSGRTIEADIIVTATGLHIDITGGVAFSVNQQPLVLKDRFAWRGFMIDSVPNLAFIIGYPVSTWTPGADALTGLFIRIIQAAESRGARSVTPAFPPEEKATAVRKPVFDLSSTYLSKARDRTPSVTGKGVWHGRINVWKDLATLWFGSVSEGLVYRG